MTNLQISNLDTKYTIDTYSIFDIDDEMDFHELDGTYDDYDWEYDNVGYVKHLAELCMLYINELIEGDSIIKAVRLVHVSSPKYYNYTTDAMDWDVEYDEHELEKHIKNNYSDFITYIEENDDTIENVQRQGKEDVYALCWYLDSLSQEGEFFDYMFGERNEHDYYTFTPVNK